MDSYHFDGLARAFAPDNRPEMVKALQSALDKNPRHTASLLLFVDHLIDAEAYDDAEEKLKLVEAINPPRSLGRHPLLLDVVEQRAREAEDEGVTR